MPGGNVRRTRSATAIATLTLIGAACSGVLEPQDILGLWELESVNGFSVPGDVTVHTHDNIARSIRVNYMRMTLRNDGTCFFEYSRGSVFSSRVFEGAHDCDYDVDLSAGVIQVVGGPPGRISASRMVLITYEDDPTERYPNEWVYRKRG